MTGGAVTYAGLLFGNHRTKRNISISDSSENDVTLDHNITISHYTSYSTEQFDASKCSDYLRAITHNRNDVCLGMFVIKRGNQQLYPSFREMSILNEIGLNSHSSSGLKSPFPLLLLMLSVPRREYDGSNSEAGWIYNIKHDCFAYTCRPSPQFSNVRLSIPSLAPDLQSEFSGEACLNTGRITSDSRCFSEEGNKEIWHERHNSGGLLSRQMANMAAAGLTQVVDTELLASGLIDSIKVSDTFATLHVPLICEISCFYIRYTL